MRILVRAIVCLPVLGLGACAGISEQECRVSDWRAVGFEDGANGRPADHIGVYRKACAEYSVAPDLDAYQRGRAEGLREYCQPGNGFQEGAKGGSYAGVCPAELETEFLSAHRAGARLHELESDVARADSQILWHEQRLDEIEDALLEGGLRIVSDGPSAEDRARLVADLKSLGEERGRLEAELRQWASRKSQSERALARYRLKLRRAPYYTVSR